MAQLSKLAQEQQLLFRTLAEQVKLPFLQIKHAAELSQYNLEQSQIKDSLEVINLTSTAALQLIDGYLLNIKLQLEGQFYLEPVSLGSVIYDVSDKLDKFARAHDCELELRVAGRYEPVMARREVVETALKTLGYSFIEALSQAGSHSKIILVVRRNNKGISTGIFADKSNLSRQLFKQAKSLKGMVRQPLTSFSSDSGAGVFVADSLFAHLDSPLKTARLKTALGLAATLTPSQQLSLV
jgi:light-regulated signal transduction histidine kinase (bacteriophytochrome)